MKKNFLLLIFSFFFVLVGCSHVYIEPATGDMDRFLLNSYGDYVTFDDPKKSEESVARAYEKLDKEVKNKIDSVYESTYQKGALDFFDISKKISISIDIKKEELEKLDTDYKMGNKESYRICNVNITMENLLFHYEQVGIRQKGNTSRGAILEDDKINLRHYKLKFSETFDDEFRENPMDWSEAEALACRENRTFFGLEKLNLRWNRNQDHTYLKEYYPFLMYRENHVLAPHANPVKVEMSIDGKTENLGIYLAVEEIDKDFIKRNLCKEAAGGDLYKLGWTNVGARFDSLDDNLFGTEKQIESNQKFYQVGYPYDLKTNKKKSKHEEIKKFIKAILETKTSDFDDFLKSSTVYDSVIRYFAISYLLGDPDDLRGNYNNAYIYFMKNTGQAIFIPTDHDRALGSTGGSGGNPTGHYGCRNLPFDNKTGYSTNDMPLYTKSILENGNTQIKKDYMKAIQTVIDANWLDMDTFLKLYYIVSQNYTESLEPGELILNEKISFYLEEGTQLNGEGNLAIRVYFNEKKNTFSNFAWDSNDQEEGDESTYYLRGEMNGWNGISSAYCLRFVNQIPTIVLELTANQAFKIATSDWSTEFNYEDLVDKTYFCSIGPEKNIGVLETGVYKIEIINTSSNSSQLKITKMEK